MKSAMKGLFILTTFILSQCSQSPTKPYEQDSLAIHTDSLEEEHSISMPNALFSFEVPENESPDDETLFEGFRKSFMEFLTGEDSVVVESYEFYHGNFFSLGSCIERTILEIRITIPASASSVVHWYTIEEVNHNWYAVYDPVTEDITEQQEEISAKISLENFLNECPVMAITYKSEGGDIDFYSHETITFYSISAGFDEILKIELDQTYDRDGYVEGDTTKATFERRTFNILTTKTKNSFDIQVDYDNGFEQRSEIYAWDGTTYSLKRE